MKQLLAADSVAAESLLSLLADQQVVSGREPEEFDPALVPELLTRKLFILSPRYGTRSSTVLMIQNNGQVEFVERQYAPDGTATGTQSMQFDIERH